MAIGTDVRALVLSAAFPPDGGGVATHVANLVHGLVHNSECHVFVFTCANAESRSSQPRHRTYKNDRLIVWKRVPEATLSFSSRDVPLAAPLQFLLSQWNTINPNLIHAHDYYSVHLAALLKSAYGVPVIATVHRAPHQWRSAKCVENPKRLFHGGGKALSYCGSPCSAEPG